MGIDYNAFLLVGVAFTEEEFLKLSDAPKQETEKRIYDTCPDDNTTNPQGKKYCGDCGRNLEYRAVTKEGVASVWDVIEGLKDYFDDIGLKLDQVFTNVGFRNNEESIYLGKKIQDDLDPRRKGSGILGLPLSDLEASLAEVKGKLEKAEKLKEAGLTKEPELLYITAVW